MLVAHACLLALAITILYGPALRYALVWGDPFWYSRARQGSLGDVLLL